MAATGLSANPKEYRARLAKQSDDQIDACQDLILGAIASHHTGCHE